MRYYDSGKSAAAAVVVKIWFNSTDLNSYCNCILFFFTNTIGTRGAI